VRATGVTRTEIPLSAPDIGEAEIAAVVAVLRGSRLSLGPAMVEFERAMAAYAGVPHAVAVSSGTAGLHLALAALGIGPGDEVVVPSFTFIAVANAVRFVGAEPVFAEIDAESLNVDPASVEAAITPRTRALIAVHTFGRPAEITALAEIARRRRVPVIEDACEAIGAEIADRRVGSFGDVAVMGFYPNKQMTTGEGGMVLTQDGDAARRIRALRNHGRYEWEAGRGAPWLDHAELGYNYRLSEVQCALGLAQLGRIEEILERRAGVARRYVARLRGNGRIHLPAIDVPQQRLSWFVFVVRLADEFTREDRDGVARTLAEGGIATGRYFAPIHLQPAYAGWRGRAHLPVTEAVAARTLALPFFNRISDEQMERVCAELEAALAAQT
jgi:perosamine synthetase